MAEKTEKQKEEEKMIREIEGKIEEVIELLSLQKDFNGSQRDLQRTQSMHQKTRNNMDLLFLHKHKQHKNVAVTKHAHGNLELIEALKMHQKFSDHPVDLLSHLDTLTDRLLLLIQKQCKGKKKA